MEKILILVLVLILIITLIYYSNNSENFDNTYLNWSQESDKLIPAEIYTNPELEKIVLEYTWNNKNRMGYNIYDLMFQKIVNDRIWTKSDEYVIKDIYSNIYDTRFETGSELGEYKLEDTYDPDKISGCFFGDKIDLAQQQY